MAQAAMFISSMQQLNLIPQSQHPNQLQPNLIMKSLHPNQLQPKLMIPLPIPTLSMTGHP